MAIKLRSTATDFKEILDPNNAYPDRKISIKFSSFKFNTNPTVELGFPYRPLELKLAGFPLAYRAVAKLAVLRFRGVLKKNTCKTLAEKI